VPIAGPLLADTPGVTALTITEAWLLSSLFNRHIGERGLTAFCAVAFGRVVGTLVFKMGASLIPGINTLFNASTTFLLHEATGWALYHIFEAGHDLSSMSKKEISQAITAELAHHDERKAQFEAKLSQLTPTERAEVELLQKELRNRRLSESEKEAKLERIQALFDRYS
jgi:hypothetical protein